MKAKCKLNNLKDISDPKVLVHLKKYLKYSDGFIDIKIGKEYIVYGILFRDNSPWLYLCDEERDEYPRPFPICLFEIVDFRLSKCWKLSYQRINDYVYSALVFDEWAKDYVYYERLVNGDKQDVEIFKEYRILMDNEYNDDGAS